MIEYKKGGSNSADEFGLEVQGASDFDIEDTPKQTPKANVTNVVEDDSNIPF